MNCQFKSSNDRRAARSTRPAHSAGVMGAMASVMMPAVFALCCVSSTSALAQEHMAAVNSDRILRESAPAKLVVERIDAEFKKRQAVISSEQAKLNGLAAQSDKLRASLQTMQPSSSDYAKTESQIQTLQAQLAEIDLDLQRKKRDFSEDLNARRNEGLQSVLDQANAAIRKIAQRDGYDLIVQEAVYVNPKIDITDQVLKMLATPTASSAPAAK